MPWILYTFLLSLQERFAITRNKTVARTPTERRSKQFCVYSTVAKEVSPNSHSEAASLHKTSEPLPHFLINSTHMFLIPDITNIGRKNKRGKKHIAGVKPAQRLGCGVFEKRILSCQPPSNGRI